MKYIDSEKLIAEIERRKKSIDECPFIEAEFGAEMRREGKIQAYNEILSLITSLQQEQPEVDLDSALTGFMGRYAYENGGEYPSSIDIARHFYELARQKYEE